MRNPIIQIIVSTVAKDIFHIYEKIVYTFHMGLKVKLPSKEIYTYCFWNHLKIAKVTISYFSQILTIFKFYRNIKKN